MTAKDLLNAISGIDDMYIEKFSGKRSFELGSPWGLAAAAAGLCLVIASVTFLHHAGLLPVAPTEGTEPITTVTEPTTEPSEPEPTGPAEVFVPGRYVYWNREDESEKETLADVGVGELYIRDELRRAMEEFENETDAVFAVTVRELTGASRQEIYDQYISKLDVVHDEYLLRQVIFVNRQQLEAMKPHEDLAIVLKLRYASGERESIMIKKIGIAFYTQEEMEQLMNEKIVDGPVDVQVEIAGPAYQSNSEGWLIPKGSEEKEKVLRDILGEYDQSDLEISYSIINDRFTLTVEKEALWNLYADERVDDLFVNLLGGEFYVTTGIDCVCIEDVQTGDLVFWAGDASENGNEPASPGRIVYSDGLDLALEYFEDRPDTVFAIRVLESTGAEYEDIYRDFIQDLDVEEDYMEHGLIYATRQQLEQIHPLKKYGFVFRLAYKLEFDDTIYNGESIDLLPEGQYRLKVNLDVGYSDEYTEEQRNQRFASMLPGILTTYGLTEENIEILQSEQAFIMTGDVDTIVGLLKDYRVHWLQVLWHEDSFVVYPAEYVEKYPTVMIPQE